MPIYVDNWTMGTRTDGLYDDDDNNCNGPKSLWSHGWSSNVSIEVGSIRLHRSPR